MAHERILLVTGTLQCGGAERVLSDIANYWSEKGLRVFLATWSGPETDDFYKLHPNVERVWLGPDLKGLSRIRINLSRVRKLKTVIARSKVEVVLSFIDWCNVLTILAARGGVRTCVSERVHPAYHAALPNSWKVLRRLLYRRAGAVVAQTEAARRWIERECGAKTRVIPNPLRKLPSTEKNREQTFLAVGRLVRQKGFDLLLEAFARIREQVPGWRVIIVGVGPERRALLEQRDRLRLASVVEIAEPDNNVEYRLARAGVVVQPSRFEGFPNVVLEAMGMGAPVVSADCPSGPSEIIVNDVNGRLVPVDDVESLADSMAELAMDSALRQRLGNRALEVRVTFGQERVMREWEQCVFPDRDIR